MQPISTHIHDPGKDTCDHGTRGERACPSFQLGFAFWLDPKIIRCCPSHRPRCKILHLHRQVARHRLNTKHYHNLHLAPQLLSTCARFTRVPRTPRLSFTAFLRPFVHDIGSA